LINSYSDVTYQCDFLIAQLKNRIGLLLLS